MHTNFSRILPNGKVNTVVKIFFLLTFIVLIAGLLWVAGLPFPYLLNNYRLNSFADQLNNIPPPPQTKRVGPSVKKFGNLGTCSKHGDYYAEFRIITSLSYPQLKTFYDQYSIQVPEINDVFSSLFRGLGTHGLQAVEVEKIEGIKNGYVVYAFDPGYWHNDFRCW
ncbi:hypothetical protein A2526_03160 [candidate division WOR-1 bacterium RIFOXYD2_FULL_36_8]|uniref:Uncharacterized protein n=1 Tax=candidate division WOR-1 bacterium RIFOXYB2_FULL_36_35 TaxID=1802578 RepID=A0A1F4S0S6_UNCSA|nr:MAG: hypothetical protein A2230_02470 [candidate division WOR-1 bacterium RIFOXYA2_FULL_36_21]OGC13997.1 MAG: hypothetical protein A2290_06495 [candidate division WOR-1 bacterium RIFOXYB2_FULL_36_35]OGC16556.1 MAG: hypothetical protein A2282_06330 [candidate division WOR-1 bacterium RIFOXYA12_FULL_36_13]OGC41301.1 MAG: hypothetical protein A2526_03160 [candidate division WOR-1 bacterium RIFOXYD2_FULL_36_8]